MVQCEVLLLALHVPNGDKAATASRSEDVRHLLVPVQRCILVGVCASLAQSEGLGVVGEIMYEELSLGASGGEYMRSERIELYCLDWARVLLDLLYFGVATEVSTAASCASVQES